MMKSNNLNFKKGNTFNKNEIKFIRKTKRELIDEMMEMNDKIEKNKNN
jgi:hypothetical protein